MYDSEAGKIVNVIAKETREDKLSETREIFDLRLDELIAQGAFSSVYRATQKSSGNTVAVKSSEKGDVSNQEFDTNWFVTRALAPVTGTFADAKVEARDLLLRQYERFLDIKYDGWASIEDCFELDGDSFIQMDYVEGETARSLFLQRQLEWKALRSIALVLANFAEIESIKYHGDLKPDNIIIDGGKVYLIDPGYFGDVLSKNGNTINVSVTTWQYYPMVKPDDMFAFGIMVLELATGEHPLKSESYYIKTLDPGLQSLLSFKSNVDSTFTRRLAAIPEFLKEHGCPVAVRDFALKCMGMKLNEDNGLELEETFSDFQELIKSLDQLDVSDESILPLSLNLQRDQRPREITKGLPLGASSAQENEKLELTALKMTGTAFDIKLRRFSEADDAGRPESIFAIDGAAFHNGNCYLSLKMPPSFTMEDEYINIWIVRVLSQGLLSTVSSRELSELSEITFRAVNKTIIERHLGKI